MASITAFFVLGEVLYPLQIFGGIAMIGAVIVLQVERERGAPRFSFEIRQSG